MFGVSISWSRKQFLVLDYISNIPRARIEGAAGTGKTVLAMEEAARSGRSGERTLLTCYNSALAKELRRRLADVGNVTVANFHGLCLSVADATGLPVESGADDRSYFEDYLPELLVKALCSDETQRFSRIVVDEGQDFLDNWWIALDEAIVPGGRIRVFFDSNQRLYDRHSDLVEATGNSFPIQLSRNLRKHPADSPGINGSLFRAGNDCTRPAGNGIGVGGGRRRSTDGDVRVRRGEEDWFYREET